MRRTLVALALAGSTLTAGPSGLWEPIWHFLSSIWSEPATKAGCGWDPSGLCTPAPPPQGDEGAGWDPSGQSKAGAGWDPSGQPAPPPQTDEGCGWDPNG